MTKTFKTSSFFYIVDFCFKIMILIFFFSLQVKAGVMLAPFELYCTGKTIRGMRDF